MSDQEATGVVGTKVMPRHRPLPYKGAVWEHDLALAGWDSLADKDKPGEIVGVFALRGKDRSKQGVVVDVYWPGVDHTSVSVFPDEVLRYD